MTNQELDKLLDQLNVVEENKGLILKVLAYMARKTHHVPTQMILASVYGSLAVFGFRGAAMLTLKGAQIAAQQAKPKNNHPVPPKGE